ncbi:hypothetical protein CAL7716_058740 [Calothrix sp. PCC 7716]|nr:hypothetical protein CAL7716_058740 [Calothrix sp. PCC 7716]
MLEQAIQDIIRKQRPYYLPQGSPIKGVDNQYWLVFKHCDADNLFKNIISFIGFREKHPTYRLVRIDPKTAKVFEYVPLKDNDIPGATLLRTQSVKTIEAFLKLERSTKEKLLLANSFLELKGRRRRFNLPDELDKYQGYISSALEKVQVYRRSTAYFDSGVLKLYEEPLRNIIQSEGKIRLLMDWQGFTKEADVKELAKLNDQDYRTQYIRRTLSEFLQGLEDGAFTGTQIMAELVWLQILQIKLVKMASGWGIYHKKTGILTDVLENHILHEGSDNFTRAAHSKNAEAVTFLYSWDSKLDSDAIYDSIRQFDSEWEREDLSFDLSQEFLQQVLTERERRQQLNEPVIETISPPELPPGETTTVEITGKNLDKVEDIIIPDDTLVTVTIESKKPESITATVNVDPDHPPTTLTEFQITTGDGTYITSPTAPPTVTPTLEISEYPEIVGYKQAVEIILSGAYGKPNDFLYWLAQQRPHQFQVESSDILDKLVYDGVLFEHQKSGAQHCLRVMQDFGVAVCADSVGLGKSRLAATVAKLYGEQNNGAKVAIIAAKKLHDNWEREMAELGFNSSNYELYNKNLMSRKGNNFLTEFNRYGGADIIILDEAHEGIRNYRNRIHRTCLQIQEQDRKSGKQRYFLLLTATPWNNRREDIYNILSPFLNRPEGFNKLNLPGELVTWFQSREIGVENFTDNTEIFRRVYKELFLQRTRQMLREATPDMNLYAKRIAEWLPVEFEVSTEEALEQIFTQFEDSLFIPFADPIRYLRENVEQRSLLRNQRRLFLQRAESSMYALQRTIKAFGNRIRELQNLLEQVTPDADGLKQFLLVHYKFESLPKNQPTLFDLDDREAWDEDYEEEEEDEDNDTQEEGQQRRQQLRTLINNYTDALRDNPEQAQHIYNRILEHCEGDLQQLDQVQNLLSGEFLRDHKREQVTNKVKELIGLGHKVLLISTFSDTVIDYYNYMRRDGVIGAKGIGMAIGATKTYYRNNSTTIFAPHNIYKGSNHRTGVKRAQVFRLFAPIASCKKPADRPTASEEISVLIGSETLSVGQNLQDADYIINIDLPWNPMILEQRIGRIDRPKAHKCENIYIYYANSESQLLRQASRLANLNKKLVGELATGEGEIPTITDVKNLGASIYGDTLFDSEVLPGYIDFINSLVNARKLEQGNLQEEVYKKQETSTSVYTQTEILYSEELSKLVKELGDDYQANPITLGRRTGNDEPTGLVALTVKYYGPNGEAIDNQTQTIFWNDQTGDKDGYGIAIATASKTPEAGDIFSAKYLLDNANNLYQLLVEYKRELQSGLQQEDSNESINTTSERITRIQNRIQKMTALPSGLDRKAVRDALKKLAQWKETHKNVQKLLREFTEGAKSKLDDESFLRQLVEDTIDLGLIGGDGIKATSLTVSLAAVLLRA